MISRSILLSLSVIPSVQAWGSLGHTTVAYLAQDLVSSKTAKFAQSLLNDTSTNFLANIATWADSYRYEKGGEFSAVYHYIDALDNPPQSCNVVFERDCPEEGCIVSAIANYSVRALQPSVGIVEQQKALKWIVHFIGDIHQPLHVENIAIGGNTINVTFDGVKTNLHAIWDTNIPQKAIGNFSLANARSWATKLSAEIKTGVYAEQSKTWLQGLQANDSVASAMVWANDANSYVCTTVLPDGSDAVFGQELGGAYYETAIPVVKQQIAKAGVRLAAWLDVLVEKIGKEGHEYETHYAAVKRREYKLEPWMLEARKARRDAGGDCGCAEVHEH